MEIWKDIKDFEGCYQVSNYGNVKSLTRVNSSNTNGVLLKPFSNGYYGLSLNGVQTKLNIKTILVDNFDIERTERSENYGSEFLDLFFKDENDVFEVSNLFIDLKDTSIRVFDYEGNMIGDYPSSEAFLREIGVPDLKAATLYPSAKGNQYANKYGFQARYLKVYNTGLLANRRLPSLVNRLKSTSKPVAKYFKDSLICVYNSRTEAAENNLIDLLVLASAMKNNTEINGFTFKSII